MPLNVEELLRRLTEAVGISGYETEVRSLVMERFSAFAEEVRVDQMGNVIALKRGSGPEPRRRIMLAAHLDEIGLIVTRIKDGFIQFSTVGGFDRRVLLGQMVTVHGRRALTGIIGSRPPHVLTAEERDAVVPLDQLYIDVGVAEVEKWVRVGDLISLRQPFVRLKGEMAAGKAMDDRAGVASLVVCLEALAGLKHRWDVYAVATAQEEMGIKGAMTSTYGIAPDLGIAVDVGFGHQQGVPEHRSVPMDKGPALAIGPNVHPRMFEKLVEVAKAHEIPYVTEALPGPTGTDAWAIQVTREGVPTCLLSIPIRYMHTTVETVSMKDVSRAGRLMAAFVAALDDETLDEIAWPLPVDADAS